MKQVEIVGGLYISLPIKEQQFLQGITSYMSKKEVDKILFHSMSETQQRTAMSLVKYNVLNYDGKYLTVRG